MNISIEHLRETLKKIGLASRDYVNAKKNMDTGEFIRQIWVARSLSKSKARKKLISELGENKEDILNILKEFNVITLLEIKEGDNLEYRFFLLPIGLELLKLIDDQSDTTITFDQLSSLVREAEQQFLDYAIIEMVKRLLEPLSGSDKMGAKSAVFCYFLLLTGATAQTKAFILQIKEEDKEFELQDEVVSYLDELSKFLFPKSYNTKKRQFKRGDLSDFIRRKKEIIETFGDLIKIENDLFYFHVCQPDGIINHESFKTVIGSIVNKLTHHASTDDNILDQIQEAIKWYRINSPVKQAYKKSLFMGAPNPEYYPLLEHFVSQALFEIESDLEDYEDEDEE